ncbi:hypothetical protein [Amycolatopsis sp. NPDC051371]|uniref:hypothetical protein n=1 Tax=Amycolatopsis sp. NPDC051371 TaxID=3155800 RepID=UPI003430E6A9
MTEQDAELPQTAAAAASPRRNRTLLYVAVAAAVLIVSAGIILFVQLPAAPPPVDYHVAVTGNVSASWVSDDSDGKLDLANGGNSEKIRAGSLKLTVQSTMPSGASCTIVDPNGNVIDTQMAFPARGTSGTDASTTVTCSTKKP